MKAIFAVAILPLEGEGCAVVAEGDREEGLLPYPELVAEPPLAHSVRFARLAAAAGAAIHPAPATPSSRRFASGPILPLAGEASVRGETQE